MLPLHPDMESFNCSGGLFDIGETDLHADIGKRCVFIAPKYPYEHGEFVIVAVQKIYTQQIAYRVRLIDNPDDFGKPVLPECVEVY